MYVRQLVGRQAGQIVEMPHEVGKAAIEGETAAAVTDAEIHDGGFQAINQDLPVTPDALLAGYRIEPSASGGGFDLFDQGGVRVNEAAYHNYIEAREGALQYARRARGLPDLFDGTDGKDEPGEDAYDKMNVQFLRAEADKRGINSSGATKRADWLALLKRDDEVKKALAEGNYDALTVDELKKVVADRKVDLGDATSKEDIIGKLKGPAPAPAAAV